MRKIFSAPSGILLLTMVLGALLAPLLPLQDPLAMDMSGRFAGPSANHWLGQDDYGRDLLSRLGDLDPSGVHLFAALAEDVGAMCKAICGAEPPFTRLAVTRGQADRLGLPTAPAKATDRRRFTGETVQCEAIDPATLADLLRDAIEARRDPEATDAILAREADLRADLVARLGGRR